MKSISTIYGTLEGVVFADYYTKSGQIKNCYCSTPNTLTTAYGQLLPRYEEEGMRQKYGKSVSFYANGILKSVALQMPHTLKTNYGKFSAELITFYENEAIKKIFPLNGKLTGFWEESNEYALAEKYTIPLNYGTIQPKLISIGFYPTGELKNLTFWSAEKIALHTPIGVISSRIGLNNYPDGSLKSFEPAIPTLIETPIGSVYAYDVSAIGIHSDSNSLVFSDKGILTSLATSTDALDITDMSGHSIYFRPETKPSAMNPEQMDTIPLHLTFLNEKVRINHNPDLEFKYSDHTFKVKHFAHLYTSGCTDCSSCASKCV